MTKQINITKYENDVIESVEDLVAIEEPLEISLSYTSDGNIVTKNISVTMRTPGADVFLATGFLFTEGIINGKASIADIKKTGFDENKITLQLHPGEQPDLQQTERNFYTTSSCGVCGKASIDAIKTVSSYDDIQGNLKVDSNVLNALGQKLKQQQVTFKSTGGLHAAALFSKEGNFISLQEDVGRHNALDKLIGEALQADLLPLLNCILLLSGRASFELVQKATMAGIRLIVAIGAPSSLAVELADEAGITLVGFLKQNSFNVYCHAERIVH